MAPQIPLLTRPIEPAPSKQLAGASARIRPPSSARIWPVKIPMPGRRDRPFRLVAVRRRAGRQTKPGYDPLATLGVAVQHVDDKRLVVLGALGQRRELLVIGIAQQRAGQAR